MSRARTRRRRSGLTLAEVLITLAILGTLAAIALPAFVEYIRDSTRSEPSTNIRNLFIGAAAYYQNESWGGMRRADGRPACTVGNATSSNVPGASPTPVDWSMESPSFRAIGFTIGDPIYYQYAIVGSADSRCDVAPGTRLYAFQARGDLDGDGTQSLYEVTAGSNERGELVRSAGIYIEREGE